jgi:outer membrane biosynthesis protein TonB
MKKTIILLFVSVLFFVFSVAEIEAQTKQNKKNQKTTVSKKIDTNQTEKLTVNAIPADSVVLEDREVVFDLEKLSLLASLSVYGKSQLKGDGLVVAEITVEENGDVNSILIRESDNPKLNRPAMDVIRNYAKKYNLQPAIKNGKPVKQEGILLPIVFDMSLFDKNKK